jgi:hypothetical protein
VIAPLAATRSMIGKVVDDLFERKHITARQHRAADRLLTDYVESGISRAEIISGDWKIDENPRTEPGRKRLAAVKRFQMTMERLMNPSIRPIRDMVLLCVELKPYGRAVTGTTNDAVARDHALKAIATALSDLARVYDGERRNAGDLTAKLQALNPQPIRDRR